jgi:hypothetical protein
MNRIYALLNNQGTACLETALHGDDYTAQNRAKVEALAETDTMPDRPLPGTWTDVTENEAFGE